MKTFLLTSLAWVCLGGPIVVYLAVRVIESLRKMKELNTICNLEEDHA